MFSGTFSSWRDQKSPVWQHHKSPHHRSCRRHAGTTRTTFLTAAALEKAEQVIAEQSLVRLALENQRTPCRRTAIGRNECPIVLP